MNDRRRPFRRGDLVKARAGIGGTYEWYVVDDDYNREYAQGPCICSLDQSRVGVTFVLTIYSCERVSPSKVPQYVLVALAKYRLTHAD